MTNLPVIRSGMRADLQEIRQYDLPEYGDSEEISKKTAE